MAITRTLQSYTDCLLGQVVYFCWYNETMILELMKEFICNESTRVHDQVYALLSLRSRFAREPVALSHDSSNNRRSVYWISA